MAYLRNIIVFTTWSHSYIFIFFSSVFFLNSTKFELFYDYRAINMLLLFCILFLIFDVSRIIDHYV